MAVQSGHGLRHTGATLMPAQVVQERLGHKNISTTLERRLKGKAAQDLVGMIRSYLK